MDKVYIEDSKFSEVISKLADEIIYNQLGEEAYVNSVFGSEYTEEAQDYFNDKFDELEAMFNDKWNVHSSSMLEIEQE
jgi:glutaredoxin 2